MEQGSRGDGAVGRLPRRQERDGHAGATQAQSSNAKQLQDIQSAGRDAGRKFWQHIRSQQQTASSCSPMLRDTATGTEHKCTDCLQFMEEYVAARLSTQRMGPKTRQLLLNALNAVVCDGVIPDGWKTSRMRIVYKKGGETCRPESYRPITVTSALYRLMGHILDLGLPDELLQLLISLYTGTQVVIHWGDSLTGPVQVSCNQAEETARHVVLECTELKPPAAVAVTQDPDVPAFFRAGADVQVALPDPLAMSLGFRGPQQQPQ
ncbi:hypothetical protein HPB48_007928 [Haemaphysalis longicornis]|uniref:Uncharacterized protein n=1 Tax=Haemaphysalis longicornis TaxID=44386 RepID=A0A9J6FSJ4_HAELO|nr:hypothetical protein HPB48_007928 [Haemaphysalis longicornis]